MNTMNNVTVEATVEATRELAKLSVGKTFEAIENHYCVLKQKFVKDLVQEDYENIVTLWGYVLDPQEEGIKFVKELFGLTKEQATLDLERLRLQFCPITAKKGQFKVLKGTYMDLKVDGGGRITIDSSKAADFTARKEADDSTTTLHYVMEGESAISRILENRGLSLVILDVNIASQDEGEIASTREFFKVLFKEGFEDISTGKHYLATASSASQTRNGLVPFVEADCPEDVETLWAEQTGYSQFAMFVKDIAKKGGEVNLTKMIARISCNGSSSTSLRAISENSPYYNRLVHTSYRCVDDVRGEACDKAYTLSPEKGVMEMSQSSRKTTPCDGMGIQSLTQAALEAAALGLINKRDYDMYVSLVEKYASQGTSGYKKLLANAHFMSINRRIPSVFQVRIDQAGGKGILAKFPLEFTSIREDVIVTKGFMKFNGKAEEDFAINICNWSKPEKSGKGNLNPQFISGLDWGGDNAALIPIVDETIDAMKEALESPSKMREYLRKYGELSSEGGFNNADLLNEVATANEALLDDKHIVRLIAEEFGKTLADMSVGKIKVDGAYTYMVCDPCAIAEIATGNSEEAHKQFVEMGLTLEKGEYYFNGLNVKAGFFRSPMLCPENIVQAQLVPKGGMAIYNDVTIFNRYDGAWEKMAGADFDGDECLVVPEGTPSGNIINRGIKDYDHIILSPSFEANKTHVSFEGNNVFVVEDGGSKVAFWDYLADFLSKTCGRSETGIISNYSMRTRDKQRSLEVLYENCKAHGVTRVEFTDPRKEVRVSINGDTISVPSQFMTKEFPIIIEVEKLPEMIEELNQKAMKLSNLNDIEIDSAKTGVKASVFMADKLRDSFSPDWMIHRGLILSHGKRGTKTPSYHGFSVLSRTMRYVQKKAAEMGFALAYDGSASWYEGTRKSNRLGLAPVGKEVLLKKLLTEQEINDIYEKKIVIKINGNIERHNLYELVDIYRLAYNKAISIIRRSADSDEQRKEAIKILKEKYVKLLKNLATQKFFDTSVDTVVAAMYLDTYDISNNSRGLGFAWLMPETLCSLFERADNSYIYVTVPSDVTNMYVANGLLIGDREDGSTFKKLVEGAEDTVFVETRYFAQTEEVKARVRRHVQFDMSSNLVEAKRLDTTKSYVIGVLKGFKYNDFGSVENAVAALQANGMKGTVAFDENDYRTYLYIGDKKVAMVDKVRKEDTDIADLVNHRIRIEAYVLKSSTIMNVKCKVIG